MNGMGRSEYREGSCAVVARQDVLAGRDVLLGTDVRQLAERDAPRTLAGGREGHETARGFGLPELASHALVRGLTLRLREWLRREWAITRAVCGIFEWVALTYLGTSSVLILWFAENVAQKLRLLGTQGFVALLILALCRKEARSAEQEKAGECAKRPIAEGEAAERDGTARAANRWTDAKNAGEDAGGTISSSIAVARVHRTAEGGTGAAPQTEANPGLTDELAQASLARRFWHFWRHWYPHLFFLFCFEEMARLVHLVQPEWQDFRLIAFDRWLTGVTPSLWLERVAHPALTEFMEFAYFTYFLFLLLLGAVLYYRREWQSYWAVMTYSAIGYALGYVIATVFPVQSPWFTLAGMWHADLTGGPFTALINFIEKCGRVRGAAFPSQHVAGATAALLGAWRHRRWLFWVFLPLVICMDVSTVYTRNHYVADVFGGLLTGTLGYVIGCWIVERSRETGPRALPRFL
jgi:membrane-associated phospholipid phosphatase